MNNKTLFALPVVSISGNGALFAYRELEKTMSDNKKHNKQLNTQKLAFDAFLLVSNLAIVGNAIANLNNDDDK